MIQTMYLTGYSLYHEIGNTQIYRNENALSLGILYDSYITKEKYETLSPLEKEDALITTAMIEENKENINKEEKIESKISNPIKLKYDMEDNKIINNSIEITKKNESIKLTVDEKLPNCEIYLNIKNLKYKSKTKATDFKVTANLDGISNNESVQDYINSAYYMENPDFLMNLGISKDNKKSELTITFNNKGTYTFDSLDVLAVPMDLYENKVNKLKTNEMTNVKYRDNFISGTIKAKNNGILQITTSYSDGWKAFVDGKETDIFKVNEAFLGIAVEEGEHNIEFKYTTPYLKVGTIFSIIGVLAYLSIIIIDKKENQM